MSQVDVVYVQEGKFYLLKILDRVYFPPSQLMVG